MPTSSRRCTRTWRSATRRLHAALKREVVGGLEPALHLARQRPGGQADPADGAPGRGAHRAWHREELAGRALCRRDQGRLRLGPRRVGQQGQPDRADGGGRDAARRRASSPSAPSTWPSAPTRKSAACAARSRSPRCWRSARCGSTSCIDEGPADHRRRAARVEGARGAGRRRREGFCLARSCGVEARARPFVDAAGRRAAAPSR